MSMERKKRNKQITHGFIKDEYIEENGETRIKYYWTYLNVMLIFSYMKYS